MLVYKNKYLNINLEATPYKGYVECKNWDKIALDRFFIVFNVQCNWELRVSKVSVDAIKKEDYVKINDYKEGFIGSMSEYNLHSYIELYAMLKILRDLWYDVDDWKIQEKIKDNLKEHYKYIENTKIEKYS